MAITLLPTPPSRQDPANFNVRADEFLGALPTFGTEANSLATDVNNKQVTASNAATTATTAASTATTKATEATNAATTATTKAADAEASAVQASKLNLGAKASAPTVDNQGASLLTGAMYFDTTLGKWRAWNGAAWVDPVSVTAGVTSLNGASGALTRTTLAAYGISDAVATSGDQTIAGNKSFGGKLLVTGGVIGYGVGAGGTVVQATSKSTSVTLNKVCGQITMHNADLAALVAVRFLVNNTVVSETDEVSVWLVNPINPTTYDVAVDGMGSGVFSIRLRNNSTTTSYSDSVVLGFAVRKVATS